MKVVLIETYVSRIKLEDAYKGVEEITHVSYSFRLIIPHDWLGRHVSIECILAIIAKNAI